MILEQLLTSDNVHVAVALRWVSLVSQFQSFSLESKISAQCPGRHGRTRTDRQTTGESLIASAAFGRPRPWPWPWASVRVRRPWAPQTGLVIAGMAFRREPSRSRGAALPSPRSCSHPSPSRSSHPTIHVHSIQSQSVGIKLFDNALFRRRKLRITSRCFSPRDYNLQTADHLSVIRFSLLSLFIILPLPMSRHFPLIPFSRSRPVSFNGQKLRELECECDPVENIIATLMLN